MINFGGIEVITQHALSKMPQDAASAWSAFDGGITGAGYKPVAYVGKQIVKGTNHVFLAEQNLVTANPERHIVVVVINDFEGKYHLVSIERLF